MMVEGEREKNFSDALSSRGIERCSSEPLDSLKNTKLMSLGVHGYYLYIMLRATSAHVIVPLA